MPPIVIRDSLGATGALEPNAGSRMRALGSVVARARAFYTQFFSTIM
ncbi:hypothetical protein [Akkermansia sp.]